MKSALWVVALVLVALEVYEASRRRCAICWRGFAIFERTDCKGHAFACCWTCRRRVAR